MEKQIETNLVVDLASKLTINEPIKNEIDMNTQFDSKLNISNPKKKKSTTLFWGIEVDPEIVISHPKIRKSLEDNPQLIPLKKMHSTLLYVGRKENLNEEIYFADIQKECQIIVSSYGYSQDALALKVDSLTFVETGKAVKSFNPIQHVTVALASNIKAMDSVKALSSEGTMVFLDELLIINGKLLRY